VSTVRTATEIDVPRMSRTAVLAFAADPLFRWFHPDLATYVEQSPSMWRLLSRRAISLGTAYVTDDIVALAIFFPPGRPQVDLPPDPAAIPPSEELRAKYKALGVTMEANTPPEPHWYLNVLATHPDWQRQGLGAALMAPIGELCRRESLSVYLETESTENVAYYGHLGFRVRSEWDVPLDGPHLWGMMREP
jgi:ribosomal protein S18 acetylase RimI-like enzyme